MRKKVRKRLRWNGEEEGGGKVRKRVRWDSENEVQRWWPENSTVAYNVFEPAYKLIHV